MPIKINFNICDNSPECSGKAVCPTDAIYWDIKKLNALGNEGTLCVDNEKCISCGRCVGDEGCPVGAIIFAKTAQELARLGKSITIDNLSIKTLFVDRFGAEPIDENICVLPNEIENVLSENVTIIEEFSEETIQCLLTSIPVSAIVNNVKELTGGEVKYYKCDCTQATESGYEYPSLKIFKGNILLAQIDGYYDNSQFDSLVERLQRAF